MEKSAIEVGKTYTSPRWKYPRTVTKIVRGRAALKVGAIVEYTHAGQTGHQPLEAFASSAEEVPGGVSNDS